jgi:hypothetical protein
MKYRHFAFTLLLLTVTLNSAAQTLRDRYNKQRPVVIICDTNKPAGYYIDVATTLSEKLNIPYELKTMDSDEGQDAFANGNADLIMTADPQYNTPTYVVSESVINYLRVSADSVSEIRLVGKDRQLIERIDDQYMRMKQDGTITDLNELWMHPELVKANNGQRMLQIADILFLLSAIIFIFSLLVLWHVRNTRKHTNEVIEMINQAQQMNKYYDIEDNQAAHDLWHKYEAILDNPYLAIAFYDRNGQLTAENAAMKKIDRNTSSSHRTALYNAAGQVTNYFVAIRIDETTAK